MKTDRNATDSTDSSTRHSRRSFLAGVGALGTGVAGLGVSRAARQSDTTTIPVVKHKGEVLESKQVPREWWAYETKVDRIAQRLRERFADASGIDGVGIARSDVRVAGKRATRPIVYTDPVSPRTAAIPDSVDGVPIASREVSRPEPETCYTGDYDSVPGGAQVGDGSGVVASATCPVEQSDGTHALMTCAHLYDRCSSDPDGEALYQSGQYVGTVDQWSVKQDWVTVPLSSYADVSGFDNAIAGTYSEVTGYVTRSGLKDHMSNDTTVYKNGRTTCETSGEVVEIDVAVRLCDGFSNESVSYDFVKTSTPTEGGDSGSPHYHEFFFNNDRKAAVIAPHYGGESVGCGAYKIRNDHGISFGAY